MNVLVLQWVGRCASVSKRDYVSEWISLTPWYPHRHYHATNMKLAVLGREPLPTLENMVGDSLLLFEFVDFIDVTNITSRIVRLPVKNFNLDFSSHIWTLRRPHSSQVRSSFVNVSSLAHDFSAPLQPSSKHIQAYAHIRHITSVKEISLPPEAVISFAGVTSSSVKLHTFNPKERGKARSGMPSVRTASQLGLRYCFEPTRASDTLSIKWLLPGMRHLFATKPMYYIASMLNNKGPGSLTALLRERELAHSASAGVSESGEDFTWFEVRVEMTMFSQKIQKMKHNQRERAGDPEGAELPVDLQEDRVVKLVQQYIAMATSPTSGFEWRWNEMKKMADINFKFAEKIPATEYVSTLSANMHHYPPEKVSKGCISHVITTAVTTTSAPIPPSLTHITTTTFPIIHIPTTVSTTTTLTTPNR